MSAPRYWREANIRYNLIATECETCKRVYFPARVVCPYCHRRSIGKMKGVKLPQVGKVFSYTIVHDPHPDYKLQTPYVLALVDLNGVKVLGQVVDCRPEDIAIEKKVKVCFRKLTEDGNAGIIHYGYKFRILEEGEFGLGENL
jgi:uncharacterized OB-fold protein